MCCACPVLSLVALTLLASYTCKTHSQFRFVGLILSLLSLALSIEASVDKVISLPAVMPMVLSNFGMFTCLLSQAACM